MPTIAMVNSDLCMNFDLRKQRQNMGIQGETVVKREWEGVLYVPTYRIGTSRGTYMYLDIVPPLTLEAGEIIILPCAELL